MSLGCPIVVTRIVCLALITSLLLLRAANSHSLQNAFHGFGPLCSLSNSPLHKRTCTPPALLPHCTWLSSHQALHNLHRIQRRLGSVLTLPKVGIITAPQASYVVELTATASGAFK